MFLMIDNYDSFTYNLVRYFEELNKKVCVVKNDEITIDEIMSLNIEAIILSPGPKHPKDAGICLEIVRKLSGLIPILGICLGHQVIGYVNNLNIECGSNPIHGKVTQVLHNTNDKILQNIPSEFRVTRYHSLVVSNNCDKVQTLALSEDGVKMIIREKDTLTYGIQYHPESFLTEYGYDILNNFIKICEEFNEKNI